MFQRGFTFGPTEPARNWTHATILLLLLLHLSNHDYLLVYQTVLFVINVFQKLSHSVIIAIRLILVLLMDASCAAICAASLFGLAVLQLFLVKLFTDLVFKISRVVILLSGTQRTIFIQAEQEQFICLFAIENGLLRR